MQTVDPQRRSLASRLVELARDHPDRLAIIDGDDRVTFSELVDRAGSLAVEIIERESGATGPLVVVGRRNHGLLISICSTLLAGRGFVIVEAEQPVARIAEIVTRVGGHLVVLEDSSLAGLLPAGVEWVAFDRARQPAPMRHPEPDPNAVACVVFTSGSTGRPKGVAFTHLSLEGRADRRLRPEVIAKNQDVVPSTGPLSYIAGLARVFDMLAGRTADMFDAGRHGPLALGEWLDDRQFHTVAMVPSLARALLQAWPSGRRLDAVTEFTTHGEGLHWADVEPLRRLGAAGGVRIEAGYSSSESSGLFKMFIEPDDPIGTGPVPLGTIREERDVRLEPVGPDPDAPTEIVVYGGPIADGYWNDPGLTAARFGVTEDGTRFYRTGDLAEIGPDGLYHYRGRADDLVKIRGLLVEPAEAERVLRHAPGVAAASVLVHDGGRRGPRLVAHIVPGADVAASPELVRAHLTAELPAHLVPSVLVRHDYLPLTPRGKVDRGELKAKPLVAWRDRPVQAPRDAVERTVASVVSEILGLDEVSIDDDLFELGADSLAIQELVVVLDERTGNPLTIADVLEASTLAGLADRLRRPSSAQASGRPLTLNPSGTRPPLVAITGAGATSVVYRSLAMALGPDQPLIGISQHGMETRGRPDRTIEAAARRAASAVAGLGTDGPRLVLGHSVGGLVAYEFARQLPDRGSPADLLVLLDVPLKHSRRLITVPGALRRASSEIGDAPAATTSWLARGITRRVRRSVRSAMAGIRPARTLEDYGAFFDIGTTAGRRYEPAPLDLEAPALLIHPNRPELVDSWSSLVAVEGVAVGGDHLSMLEPPHVAAVAEAIRRRIDQVISARQAEGQPDGRTTVT